MAAPTDWQLGCTEMKQRGSHLLRSGQWSDCTFLVGTEPHQVVVNGHKLILAMASPVFEAMFFGGMAERNEPIPILDVQPEAFKALLEYIYTDNIVITSFDKACELCYGAKKYMLPHLVKECTRYLWSDLYPRNACRAYEFARLFEENVLMDKCLQIISTNTKDVLNDPSFEDVDINTVITVFSQDHLNIDSELDLFDACVRYSKAQDKRLTERSVSPSLERPSPGPSTSKDKVVNIESSAENSPLSVTEHKGDGDQPVPESITEEPTPSQTKKDDKPDIKSRLRAAIENIRFLTLTPQQFAEGPARSSLLTESESFAVLMNILSSSSDVPMPQGFSTCRVPRKQLIGGPSSNVRAYLPQEVKRRRWSSDFIIKPIPRCFDSGNFILRKSDVKWLGDIVITSLDSVNIWHINGSLLQKYIPILSNGKVLHKITCVYSRWNANKYKDYYSITEILDKDPPNDLKEKCVALNLKDLFGLRFQTF